MTRINIGIEPEELCDQMLIAECCKELPRLYNFKPKSAAPAGVKLGKGHVLWCSQYMGSIIHRHKRLIAEMVFRGFHVSNMWPPEMAGAYWSETDEKTGRGILIERIQLRLTTMKRVPTWTSRTAPTWARKAIANGHHP
jgi:hypothetical protein